MESKAMPSGRNVLTFQWMLLFPLCG